GNDVDGNSLAFKLTSLPSHGTLYNGNSTAPADLIGSVPYTASAAQVTYKPAANYNGSDSFQFKANYGFVDSASAATVAITVNPVNDAPTATVSLGDHSPKTNETLT